MARAQAYSCCVLFPANTRVYHCKLTGTFAINFVAMSCVFLLDTNGMDIKPCRKQGTINSLECFASYSVSDLYLFVFPCTHRGLASVCCTGWDTCY